MRLTKKLLIVFVLGTTWPTTRASADPVVPKIITPCTLYLGTPVADPKAKPRQVCGYENIDDYKLVLKVDNDAFYLDEELKKERAKTASLSLEAAAYKGQVDALERAQKLLVERNEKLVSDFLSLDEKYQQARIKPGWGSPLAWGIAGLATAVLAGVLIGDAL